MFGLKDKFVNQMFFQLFLYKLNLDTVNIIKL